MTKTKSIKAELRKGAEERQEKYSKLTLQQKIDLAKSRPGASKKEIAKLMKRLEESNKSKKGL